MGNPIFSSNESMNLGVTTKKDHIFKESVWVCGLFKAVSAPSFTDFIGRKGFGTE